MIPSLVLTVAALVTVGAREAQDGHAPTPTGFDYSVGTVPQHTHHENVTGARPFPLHRVPKTSQHNLSRRHLGFDIRSPSHGDSPCHTVGTYDSLVVRVVDVHNKMTTLSNKFSKINVLREDVTNLKNSKTTNEANMEASIKKKFEEVQNIVKNSIKDVKVDTKSIERNVINRTGGWCSNSEGQNSRILTIIDTIEENLNKRKITQKDVLFRLEKKLKNILDKVETISISGCGTSEIPCSDSGEIDSVEETQITEEIKIFIDILRSSFKDIRDAVENESSESCGTDMEAFLLELVEIKEQFEILKQEIVDLKISMINSKQGSVEAYHKTVENIRHTVLENTKETIISAGRAAAGSALKQISKIQNSCPT